MKARIVLILLIGVISHLSYAQCEAVTVDKIANYDASPIDTLYEADGLRNGPDYDGSTLYYPITK